MVYVRIQKDYWGLLIRPEWNWNSALIAVSSVALSLLIRPEWNWNCFWVYVSTSLDRLLIRPEWNWNIHAIAIIIIKDMTFNQTRMELKQDNIFKAEDIIKELLIRPEWNWNKPRLSKHQLTKYLLIRPEWNWNSYDKGGISRAGGF